MTTTTQAYPLSRMELLEARDLIHELTAFDESLDDLIDRWTKHGYRPTLLKRDGRRTRLLADYYDHRAAERGIDVKCYRGS